MRGAVIHAPGDVRVEEREDPKILAPTDAIIRLAATCVCGSDLWDYRGINPVNQPTPTSSSTRRSSAHHEHPSLLAGSFDYAGEFDSGLYAECAEDLS